MQVATARYAGTMRSQQYQGPSGQAYRFRSYSAEAPDGHGDVAVGSVADARFLAGKETVTVDWTAYGTLVKHAEGPLAAVDALGYQAKQRLVGSDGFDLDVAGNADEETMEEALQDHVQKLHEEGDL